MSSDDLEPQGARSSVDMVWTWFTQCVPEYSITHTHDTGRRNNIFPNFRVVFRGNNTDTAVLCSESCTYQVRVKETSNNLLLVPDCKVGERLQGDDEAERHIHHCEVRALFLSFFIYVFLSLFMSFFLHVFLSSCLSFFMSFFLHAFFVSLSLCLSFCLCVSFCLFLSVCLSFLLLFIYSFHVFLFL